MGAFWSGREEESGRGRLAGPTVAMDLDAFVGEESDEEEEQQFDSADECEEDVEEALHDLVPAARKDEQKRSCRVVVGDCTQYIPPADILQDIPFQSSCVLFTAKTAETLLWFRSQWQGLVQTPPHLLGQAGPERGNGAKKGEEGVEKTLLEDGPAGSRRSSTSSGGATGGCSTYATEAELMFIPKVAPLVYVPIALSSFRRLMNQRSHADAVLGFTWWCEHGLDMQRRLLIRSIIEKKIRQSSSGPPPPPSSQEQEVLGGTPEDRAALLPQTGTEDAGVVVFLEENRDSDHSAGAATDGSDAVVEVQAAPRILRKRRSKKTSVKEELMELLLTNGADFLRNEDPFISDDDTTVGGELSQAGTTEEQKHSCSTLDLLLTPFIMPMGVEFIDLKDVSLGKITMSAFALSKFGKLAAEVGVANYPEKICRCVIVDGPSVLETATKLVLIFPLTLE